MKKLITKSMMTVVSVMFTTFMLTACGSGGEKSNPPSAQPSSEAKGEQQIKVGYVNILSMAPAVIEKQKGFLKQQGLNAEFFSFSNGPDLNKALISGKLDVAYIGMPVAVNWASRGAQIKVLAKADDGKFGVMVKPDSPIKQPADLKGKKIGSVVKGSGGDFIARGFLLPEGGLDEKDVNLVQLEMPNMEQAVQSNTVDAAVAGEPFLTFAETRGLKVVKELPDPAVVVVARQDFLKQNGDIVKKFIQGHVAAINYLNQNKKEAADDLAKAYQVAEISANGKTYQPADLMEKALNRNKFEYKFSDQDMKFYQQVADVDLKLKFIDKPFDVKTLFDTSYLK